MRNITMMTVFAMTTVFTWMTGFGALLMAAPARAELVVSISKAQQRLSVSVNGAEAYRWPVSTGRRGYTTPSGTYRPTRLERRWYSRKYDWAPMPWSVFFHRGYAVHGTTEAHNLGRPASHGCVRLRPDNASILFSMVRRYGAKHTKVVVMNGPLPRLPDAQPMAQAPGEPRLAQAEAKSDGERLNAKAEANTNTETKIGTKPEAKNETKIEAKRDIKGHSDHLSAKAHAAVPARNVQAADDSVVKRPVRTRVAAVERYSVSVGSEAQVLRERDAWLRSLDRKYGITR